MGKWRGVTLPDEVNLLQVGADFGWPRCYGVELTGPDCEDVRPAVAEFEAQATPTSITLSPFAPDTLLVALWVTGEVVQLPFTLTADNALAEIQPFVTGLDRPQHLVTHPDGSVWMSDFARGKIYRIWQEE